MLKEVFNINTMKELFLLNLNVLIIFRFVFILVVQKSVIEYAIDVMSNVKITDVDSVYLEDEYVVAV